jgi:6-bladed beta-propeller
MTTDWRVAGAVWATFIVACPPVLSAQALDLAWEIGAIDGAVYEVWDQLRDAMVIDDQVIAVDVGASLTRVFTLSGEYVGERGRMGQGPGEFLRPTAVAADRANVYVSDFAQSRVVVFDRDLNIVGTSRELYPDLTGLGRVQPLRAGWVFGDVGPVWSFNDQRMIAHAIAWRDSEIDTLGSFEANHLRVVLRDDETRHHSLWVTTGAGEDWWPLNERYVAALSTDGKLRVLEASSDGLVELKSVQLRGTPRAVTESEIDRWVSHRESVWPESADDNPRYEFPEMWTPWGRVRGSHPDSLWVQRGGMGVLAPQLVPEVWVRFDDAGVELERFSPGIGVTVLRIQDPFVLSVRIDEYQVEYLQLSRISR